MMVDCAFLSGAEIHRYGDGTGNGRQMQVSGQGMIRSTMVRTMKLRVINRMWRIRLDYLSERTLSSWWRLGVSASVYISEVSCQELDNSYRKDVLKSRTAGGRVAHISDRGKGQTFLGIRPGAAQDRRKASIWLVTNILVFDIYIISSIDCTE